MHEQIDESGHVTGIIDFEGTTIAPLWECALLPRWLQDPDDPESSYEGGSAESRQTLRALFLEKVENGEWRAFYEKGKPFRLLCDRLQFKFRVWASEDMRNGWMRDLLGHRIILALDCLKVTICSERLYPVTLSRFFF
jgi:hypothetical protein